MKHTSTYVILAAGCALAGSMASSLWFGDLTQPSLSTPSTWSFPSFGQSIQPNAIVFPSTSFPPVTGGDAARGIFGPMPAPTSNVGGGAATLSNGGGDRGFIGDGGGAGGDRNFGPAGGTVGGGMINGDGGAAVGGGVFGGGNIGGDGMIGGEATGRGGMIGGGGMAGGGMAGGESGGQECGNGTCEPPETSDPKNDGDILCRKDCGNSDGGGNDGGGDDGSGGGDTGGDQAMSSCTGERVGMYSRYQRLITNVTDGKTAICTGWANGTGPVVDWIAPGAICSDPWVNCPLPSTKWKIEPHTGSTLDRIRQMIPEAQKMIGRSFPFEAMTVIGPSQAGSFWVVYDIGIENLYLRTMNDRYANTQLWVMSTSDTDANARFPATVTSVPIDLSNVMETGPIARIAIQSDPLFGSSTMLLRYTTPEHIAAVYPGMLDGAQIPAESTFALVLADLSGGGSSRSLEFIAIDAVTGSVFAQGKYKLPGW